MMYNLNHTSIKLKDFPLGKTYNIELKIGREYYYLDVDKNACATRIDFYKRTAPTRHAQSKYADESERCGVYVRPNAVITRGFLYDLPEFCATVRKLQNLRTTRTVVDFTREFRGLGF